MRMSNFLAPAAEFSLRFDPRNRRQLNRARRITQRVKNHGVIPNLTQNRNGHLRLTMRVQPFLRQKILRPNSNRTRKQTTRRH
jgi:hypothetical protein